jgi:hypothetical protein
MVTIGEAVSRVRNIIKASTEDAFITDRFIFSIIMKHAKHFIRRQDSLNEILRFNSFFRRLPCVELIEVDRVEACCDVKSNVTVMRTREKIPGVMDSSFGALFRTVASVDDSTIVYKTEPVLYNALSKTSGYKYNKQKYYWYLNGYLYFPNVVWQAVSVEGIFEQDLTGFTCTEDPGCIKRQEQQLIVPEYLFTEIEAQVLNDLKFTMSVPNDVAVDDKQNILR